jgi:hypothetical protein
MAEQDPSPLAGLTEDQADEAIARFEAKVEQHDEAVKAQKAHLKAMKAARKHLEAPEPPDGNGVVAHAQPAEITVEGGEVG